jgi:hypothetical protein
MRWPSRVPGLMRNSSGSRRVTTPAPSQVALDVELHASAHLGDLAGAVALGAFHGTAGGGLAFAGGAELLALDFEAGGAAADGGPEVDGDLVFEVGAGLGALLLGCALASVEHAGEDVLERASEAARVAGLAGLAGAASGGGEVGEVKASEVEGDLLGVAARAAGRGRGEGIACGVLAACGGGRGGGVDGVGVEAELVEDLALFVVGEDVVGFGDLLELFFGLLVAGVDVGVVLARELAEGLADLVRGGVLLDA